MLILKIHIKLFEHLYKSYVNVTSLFFSGVMPFLKLVFHLLTALLLIPLIIKSS
jgi:hypothetical protein